MSYPRICLNTQLQLKKSILTIEPAYVIWMTNGSVKITNGSIKLMPQYVAPQAGPIHNSKFSYVFFKKAMYYLSNIPQYTFHMRENYEMLILSNRESWQ